MSANKRNYFGKVAYFSDLKKVILKYTERVLIAEEINDIINIIQSNIITDENRKQEHVHNIYVNINKSKNDIKNGACPKCGRRLVSRRSKYGNFTGCSNYPGCRFILK